MKFLNILFYQFCVVIEVSASALFKYMLSNEANIASVPSLCIVSTLVQVTFAHVPCLHFRSYRSCLAIIWNNQGRKSDLSTIENKFRCSVSKIH